MRATPTRVSAVSSVAVAFATAALVAVPADAAATKTVRCDARGGTTLTANTTLRFYKKTVGSQTKLYACRYKGNRNVSLGPVGKRREVEIYGANGRYLFWVNQTRRDRSSVDTTTRYSGVFVFDAVTRKTVVAQLAGFAWASAAISSTGRVAGAADAEGQQLQDSTTGQPVPPVSGIFTLNPKAAGSADPAIETVASAPLGTISAFGVTPDTIVWRQPDGLHTAAFS